MFVLLQLLLLLFLVEVAIIEMIKQGRVCHRINIT